jgi:hypothetical protein
MELLRDPLKDRKIKKVRPPPHRPLAEELMFPKQGSGRVLWLTSRQAGLKAGEGPSEARRHHCEAAAEKAHQCRK